jgi:hypothetical protein
MIVRHLRKERSDHMGWNGPITPTLAIKMTAVIQALRGTSSQ